MLTSRTLRRGGLPADQPARESSSRRFTSPASESMFRPGSIKYLGHCILYKQACLASPACCLDKRISNVCYELYLRERAHIFLFISIYLYPQKQR